MDIKILVPSIFIIGALLIAYILIYNILIGSLQKVKEAWSGVDVQLKRRHDLIGNLIDVAKGYAHYEKELLEKITEERTTALAMDQKDISKLSDVETALETDLKSFIAVAEAYPDLKANTVYLQLQKDLAETEDQIASSRRIYNSNVTAYNTLIAVFPQNIVAKLGHFQESPFFQKDQAS